MTRSPAHLLHVFPTFVAAGLQMRAVQLMAAFEDRFRHSILALDGNVSAGDLLPPGVEVEYLTAPARSAGPLAGARTLRRLIAERRPDLLLTYNWGSFDAVLAARFARLRRHVHHEDGFNVDEAVQQKRRRVLTRRLFLPHAFRTVVPAHNLKRIACEVWRLPEHKVQLIPNGVHLDRFMPEAPDSSQSGQAVRERFGIPIDALVVGAVGHLRPVKNFGRLLAACSRIAPAALAGRPLHVLLLGDGTERAALENAAREHAPPGGSVHFAGHQEHLPPYYRAMDVFALSSDSEQQPISLLEAMATGVAAVSTDVGDVKAVLHEEQRPFVVPLGPDVENRLTRALETLLANADLRAKLAGHGLERVGLHYSFRGMLASYRDLYEAALRA